MKDYLEPLAPRKDWTATVGIGAHYQAEITRQALKVLENNLTFRCPSPKPTRWERIKAYFANLWNAICGRCCENHS